MDPYHVLKALREYIIHFDIKTIEDMKYFYNICNQFLDEAEATWLSRKPAPSPEEISKHNYEFELGRALIEIRFNPNCFEQFDLIVGKYFHYRCIFALVVSKADKKELAYNYLKNSWDLIIFIIFTK